MLKEWQRKYSFAPIGASAKLGPALPIAICHEKSDAMPKLTGNPRPA